MLAYSSQVTDMDKVFFSLVLLELVSQIFSEKLLVCHVDNKVCIFQSKKVNKDEKIQIVADHPASSTDDDITEVKFIESMVHTLPSELFSTFKNLQTVQIDGSGIKEIKPNTFMNAKNLKQLILTNNELTEIEENMFMGAENLEKLMLNYNKIANIHKNAFKNLTKLQHLSIGGNQLKSVDRNLLSTLKDLNIFSIYTNQLRSLHRNLLRNNRHLVDLHFQENAFNALSSTMFSHLDKLHTLDLQKNNCVDKKFEGASQQMAFIEDDLSKCGHTYMGLETEEILSKLDEMLKYVRVAKAEDGKTEIAKTTTSQS